MLYRFATLALTISSLLADGPADNVGDKVRAVPPPGQPIPDDARQEVAGGLDKLHAEIAELSASSNKTVRSLVPDVQIFFNALDYAFRYNEFLNGPKDVPDARKLLQQGLERAAELKAGKASWTNAPGLIVRGYVSKIDGSVQPYGLVVPPTYPSSFERPHRLDAWFHGRGENLTELRFLIDRQKDPGQFTPPGAFVLHLYGRYCNANKFAGEIDLFEALADVKQRYRIDDDRIVIRGFSMGGAACWQFAVHYPANGLRPPREPASPKRKSSSASSKANQSLRRRGNKNSGIGTIPPITPSICSTCQPSLTAAKSISKSKPPT
jgi:hypothetical protein